MATRRSLWVNLAGAAIVGAACAALALLPAAVSLEEDVGLRWLFQLRGPVTPPEEVVLVLINERAASRIHLPADVRFHRCENLTVGSRPQTHMSLPTMASRWPRCLHAILVNKLAQAGASAIAFDVLFPPRPPLPATSGDLNAWQDKALAEAFEASGRVVIAQGVKSIGGRESIAVISAPIEAAALGKGPFSLTHSSSGRINRFVAFQETGWTTPGLPVLALQAFALDEYPRMAASLVRHSPDGDLLMPVPQSMPLHLAAQLLRKIFRDDPKLSQLVANDLSHAPSPDASRGNIEALMSMYEGESSRWLNFHGPAGWMRAYSYDRILEAEPDWLVSVFKGRAVFVGYGDTAQFEQSDHFPTAFSSLGHPDHSGVEIAATAFGNLLHGTAIRRISLDAWIALIFLCAAATLLACRTFSLRVAAVTLAIALPGIGAAVLYAFSMHNLWIAYILPMFVAMPSGALCAYGWNFLEMRRERDRMRRAVRIFVPREIAQQIEQNASLTEIEPETIECGCVATDAANYTPLSQTMSSEQLAKFLNNYFRALFEPVAVHGGFVSDIVGDAMLAIWKSKAADTRMHMLRALLEMRDAAQDFNEARAGSRLMTRFGVDWGPVTLTAVGALDHYEYRAVGMTVNLAARIQELNKKLGTRVLVSRSSLGDAAGAFLVRECGTFLLRGSRLPTQICELIAPIETGNADQRELAERFGVAQKLVFEGRPDEALALFGDLLNRFPDDGPSAFYLARIASGIDLQMGAIANP